MIRTSKCSCGACTAEVEGEPTINALCNCDDCRRRTGAPFSWSVYFPDGQIRKVSGPLKIRVVQPVDSDVGANARSFCADCGSTLFWRSDVWLPGQTGFAAGCFNDPTLPAPTVAVRHAQRMPWAVFPAECQLVP